jgi:homoserine kinase
MLIPGFEAVKSASMNSGALGCGISGSGPSIFAFSQGKKQAEDVAEAMKKIYQDIDIDYDVHVSKINPEGIRIMKS